MKLFCLSILITLLSLRAIANTQVLLFDHLKQLPDIIKQFIVKEHSHHNVLLYVDSSTLSQANNILSKSCIDLNNTKVFILTSLPSKCFASASTAITINYHSTNEEFSVNKCKLYFFNNLLALQAKIDIKNTDAICAFARFEKKR